MEHFELIITESGLLVIKSYLLDDNTNTKIEVEYYLAPRVESD